MHKYMRHALCGAAWIGLLWLMAPVAWASDGAPRAAAATAPDDVAQLYRRHCAACHGDRGDGRSRAQFGLNPPPRDFTSPEAWYELSHERMLTSIKYGRPGTAMVAWEKQLSDAEIEALAGYIRQAFMRDPGDDSLHRGKQLYKRQCSACHGDRGNGASWAKNSLNPSPRDFTAPESRAELTRERMLTSVTHGRPGTAMMPFQGRLSEVEITAVVDYIRAEFMSGEPTAAGTPSAHALPPPVTAEAPPEPADMTLAFPHGLTGDYKRGRTFYMKNCYTCHGRRGDGRGPRASFIKPPPRNFLGERSRQTLNRPALYRAIFNGINGTVMPAWSRVLDEQQIADVAEFVFQEFIQGGGGAGSAPRQAPDSGGEGKKKAL